MPGRPRGGLGDLDFFLVGLPLAGRAVAALPRAGLAAAFPLAGLPRAGLAGAFPLAGLPRAGLAVAFPLAGFPRADLAGAFPLADFARVGLPLLGFLPLELALFLPTTRASFRED